MKALKKLGFASAALLALLALSCKEEPAPQPEQEPDPEENPQPDPPVEEEQDLVLIPEGWSWPESAEAWDYGLSPGQSRTATLSAKILNPQGVYNSSEGPRTSANPVVCDGVTYGPGASYWGNRFTLTSSKVGGTGAYLPDGEIPTHNYISFKVNHPGYVSFSPRVSNTGELYKYKVLVVKTVQGVTYTKVVSTVIPTSSTQVEKEHIETHNYDITVYVSANELSGADGPATIYLYHTTKQDGKGGGVGYYHITWMSVSAQPVQPGDLFAEDFFGRFEDPNSGVVSYYLKNEPLGNDNSQSVYFMGCEFTDDERFLMALCSTNETRVRNGEATQQRFNVILDLKHRKVYSFPNKSGGYPWLDPVEDKLYYCVRASDQASAQFFRRDLLVDPSRDIALASYPAAALEPNTSKPIARVLSHITLTSDKQKVFLDSWLKKGSGTTRSDYFCWGLLDLYTGEWEEWGRSTVDHVTHGQINPLHDDEALCAIDYWDDAQGVRHNRTEEPDGTCRRLQHVKKNYLKTIPPSIDNGATHEGWAPDGDHVYFCNGGINLTNVRTGEKQRLLEVKSKSHVWHCHPTRDMSAWTFDDDYPDYYRGCAAKVHFWNAQTGKRVLIYSSPLALNDKENASNLHPDPHPHFVCKDKYVICTMTGKDLNLHVSLTPVDQLKRLTEN